jgi:hypothetical protein
MDGYLSTQRQTIFKNVAVLIYVFDTKSRDWEEDVRYFEQVLEGLAQMSGDDDDSAGEDSDDQGSGQPKKKAGVYVLINKMDLEDPSDRARIERERAAELLAKVKSRIGGRCMAFGTSIWDESLYKVRPGSAPPANSLWRLIAPSDPSTGMVGDRPESHPQRPPPDRPSVAATGEGARGRGRPVRAADVPRRRPLGAAPAQGARRRPAAAAKDKVCRRRLLGTRGSRRHHCRRCGRRLLGEPG